MKHYDSLYQKQNEPWAYSERAVELLRHKALVEKVKSYLQPSKSLLEIGCSKGLLSVQLAPLTHHLAVMEISPTALEEAKKNLHSLNHEGSFEFHIGSALQLPFEDNFFQCVLAADGIHEWGLSQEEKQKVYGEIFRVLKPGGHAIFSDYLRPEWFPDVIQEFQKSSFQMIETEYFGDRFSYQLESVLKAFQKTRWAKSIKANLRIAQTLQQFGKKIGPSGSRHLFWVGKKL